MFSINDVSASTPVFFKFKPDDVARDGEVRDLLERGDSSVDPDVRRGAYAKALALIQERAYALPLYSLPMYYVAAKDLEFTAYPDEMPRFWEMRLEVISSPPWAIHNRLSACRRHPGRSEFRVPAWGSIPGNEFPSRS